ncbi:TPA: hypothetical protein VK377_000629 [Streptococcus pyogenes]|nr:hypothetical protein [Streptococcus pyogenes]
MDELKEKALSKMLDEMNKKHSAAEDAIHNWLSDQDDEELFKGILDDKKSIKDAMKYCINQAQKQKTGNCSMVDDKTVFGWVRVYFTGKTKKIEPVQATVTVSQENTKVIPKKNKKSKGVVEGQLDLFGALV